MKLEKCFNKSLNQILGLRVSQLNLEEQFQLFKPFRIFPLHLRLFRHNCLFLYNLIKNGKAVYILSKITRLEGRDLRNPYSVPGFNLCAGKFCFSRVAPKLLNSFLQNFSNFNLNYKIFINNFDNNILNLFNTHFYLFFK